MRKITQLLGAMAVMVILVLFTGCSDNKQAETNPQVESGSLEEAAPEPAEPAIIDDVDAIPENVINAAERFASSFFMVLGEEVSVDQMEIGQRIPSYDIKEDGVEQSSLSWPVYVDGEMKALLIEWPDGEITIDFNVAPRIIASDLDTVALVYDDSYLYFCDGTQLIKDDEWFAPVNSNVALTDANEAEVIAACKLGRVGAIIGGVTE